MQIRLTTKYAPKGDLATIKFSRYENGQVAMIIVNQENDTLMKATTAIEPEVLQIGMSIFLVKHGRAVKPSHIVVLKTYSENEGIEKCLIDQGVLGEKVFTCTKLQLSGEVDFPIYTLSEIAIKHLNQSLH